MANSAPRRSRRLAGTWRRAATRRAMAVAARLKAKLPNTRPAGRLQINWSGLVERSGTGSAASTEITTSSIGDTGGLVDVVVEVVAGAVVMIGPFPASVPVRSLAPCVECHEATRVSVTRGAVPMSTCTLAPGSHAAVTRMRRRNTGVSRILWVSHGRLMPSTGMHYEGSHVDAAGYQRVAGWLATRLQPGRRRRPTSRWSNGWTSDG